MNMYPNNPVISNNPYYLTQFPFTNPVIPNYQVVQQTAPHREIDRVNGKESAYAFALGPNSSVVLVDNLAPKIWIVTTDSSGYKAVTGFKIVPDDEDPIQAEGNVENEDPVQKLTERLNKLEERMNAYGQSNPKSSWQNKSGNGNAQPNDWNSQNGKGSDVGS